MLKSIDHALMRLSTALAFIAAFAVAAITILVILSSTMRYIVRVPFSFTEELVGLLFLTSSMLSLPYVAAHRQTIRVVLLVRLLPARLRIVGDVFDHLVVLVFALWFAKVTLDYDLFALDLQTRSEQSDILLWPWIALMPFGSCLVAVITLVQLLRRLLDPGSVAAAGGAAHR